MASCVNKIQGNAALASTDRSHRDRSVPALSADSHADSEPNRREKLPPRPPPTNNLQSWDHAASATNQSIPTESYKEEPGPDERPAQFWSGQGWYQATVERWGWILPECHFC